MKFKNLVSILAALGVFTAGTANAQFTDPFSPDYSTIVAGWIDTSIYGQLNAGIEVDFVFADVLGDEVLTSIMVKVTNYGPATSAITGFWLQQPIVGDVYGLGQPTPYSTSTDDWAMTVDGDGNNELPEYMGGPESQLGDPDRSLYFGAAAGERLNVPGDNVGYFTFSVTPGLFDGGSAAFINDWLAGGDTTNPLVFVRWQEVVYDGIRGRSGKGAGGPGWEPGVPEPSEVAALAVLGLGGILFIRRRFTKKAK